MKTELPQTTLAFERKYLSLHSLILFFRVPGKMAFRKQNFKIPVSLLSPHIFCLLLLAMFTELVPAEETEQDKEHTCETLLMCIVTVLSHGLRSGGGVGDVLRKPSKEVN